MEGMGRRTTNEKGYPSASTAVEVGGKKGRDGEVQAGDAREEEARARAMVRRRTDMDRLERAEAERIDAEEASRMEVERWAAAEAAHVSTERRAAMEGARIAVDVAQLKQRGKPPRIRQHRLKRRGGRPQQRRSATNGRGGKKGKLVQFVRK